MRECTYAGYPYDDARRGFPNADNDPLLEQLRPLFYQQYATW